MRAAIAMIELIFAIVILGIVMLSAPMLISTASQSGYVALQQEAIATASSEIGMILTHHWDEGDTNDTLSAPILVTVGHGDLAEGNNAGLNTGRRRGTPNSSSRTFTLTSGPGRIPTTLVANFGSDGGDMDDVDDFIGNSGVIDIDPTTAEIGDIVDTNTTMNTVVQYRNDTPSGAGNTYDAATVTLNQPFLNAAAGATSNIKHVQVNLTTTNTATELDKDITLNAFTCNIGTYELNEGRL